MKKIMFLSLIFVLVFFGSISAMAVSEGDCIVAGEYDGKPIIWRCIDVSDDGVYLISDTVLFNRKYDSNGSSLWSSSEIRAYLNGEFLQNCLGKEGGYILSKDIKTVSTTIDNESQHIYNNGFENSVQNYESSYRIDTTDKIFLPSVEEIQSIYKNIGLYGSDFYMGKDAFGNYIDYYLRDSLSFSSNAKYVRCVSSDMDIYYSTDLKMYYDRLVRNVLADSENVGIRPAMYISADTPLIKGDGSKEDPYEIPGTYFCEIRPDCDAIEQGTDYIPDVFYNLSYETQYIKYYNNGIEYDLDESCVIGYGENEFCAKIYDLDGNKVYESEPKIITGYSPDPGTNRLMLTFEEEKPLSKFAGYGVLEGDTIDIFDVGGDHKNVLRIDAHGASTFINSASLKNYTNILTIESEIMLCDWNFTSRPVYYVCVYKGTSKLWLTPIMIYPNGKLIYDDGSGQKVIRDDIELDKWYKFTLIYDVANNKATLLMDDELCLYNADTSTQFDYVSYLNISYASSGGNSKMYFDNMRISSSKQSMTGSRYGTPHYNAYDFKTFDFSTESTSYNKVGENADSFSEIEEYDEVRGKVGHVKTVGTDSKRSLSARNRDIFSSTAVQSYNTLIMEFEFNIVKNEGDNSLLGAISYRNAANIEKTWGALYFTKNGELYISKDFDNAPSATSLKVKVKEFTMNEWHKVRYVIDTEKLLIYVYFDGILYSEVDCGRSAYTGNAGRAFSVENSRKSCYFEIQASTPGKEGLVNEFYVDNISMKVAKSPVVYNVEYENDGKRIFNKDQISDFSSLKINADVLASSDIKAITSAILSNGELDSVTTSDVTDMGNGLCHAYMEIRNLSPEIVNGRISSMFWKFDTLTPVSDVVSLN